MSQERFAHASGWKVVFVAHSEPEAAIVAGRLETQGIETFIHRETAGNAAYGVYIDPFGDVSVLVHPDDYHQAGEILDEDVSEAIPDDDDDDDDESDETQP